MNSDVAPHRLVALPLEECLLLLRDAPQQVGRLGVVDDGQPLVMPVNFRVHEGEVVVRLDEGSLLASLVVGERVAFEADALDPGARTGWSVLVQGTGVRIHNPARLELVRRMGLRPWAPGTRELYVRIAATSVTGRRII